MSKASQEQLKQGANIIIKIIAFTAMLALLTPLGAFADALNPEPLPLLQAAYATFNLGNVDAAMGFFPGDEELWDSRGKNGWFGGYPQMD